MPDSFGFTHEPHHGRIFNRCIECDQIPWGVTLSEKDRARHHKRHENVRQHAIEQKRMAALRLARKAKREYA